VREGACITAAPPQRKVKRPGGQGSREGRKNTAERKGFVELLYPHNGLPLSCGVFFFFQTRLDCEMTPRSTLLAVLLQPKTRNPNQTMAS
jgi:hypothetical protein